LGHGTPLLARFVLVLRLVAELLDLSPNPLADFGDSLAGADADIFSEFARPSARKA
jgi:hypothetical protein